MTPIDRKPSFLGLIRRLSGWRTGSDSCWARGRKNRSELRPLIAGILCAALAACQQSPITGRQQLVLIPENQAVQMGADAYQQILAESKISRDQALAERVNQVGTRLAQGVEGDEGYEWEFTLIDDPTPNAFALPGGKIGVHTGLFEVARNDAQLAAVLAHEIGHVTARHSAERISRQILVETGLVGLGAAGGAQYADLAAQAATLGLILPFSRSQESEADALGLYYMAEAGYDPREAVALWENFDKLAAERPPAFLATHPAPGDRIAQIRSLLPKVMPIYEKSAQR